MCYACGMIWYHCEHGYSQLDEQQGGISHEYNGIDQRTAGCSCPGTDLGNYGNRCLYYFQNTGYCRFDGRWHYVYRRCCLYYDDDEWTQRMGSDAGGIYRRYAGRFCNRLFPYLYGNSGNSFRYSDPAGTLVSEPEDHGQVQPGTECG